MGDGKGTFAIIDFRSLDEMNKGFGYQICPDLKQDHAYDAIMKVICELYDRISSPTFGQGGKMQDKFCTSA